MSRISSENQVTIPVAVLEKAGLHAGDEVVVGVLDDGRVFIRRALRLEYAFGALTDVYHRHYLETLDAEDSVR